MHPDVIRAMSEQRNADLRSRAAAARRVRAAIKARRQAKAAKESFVVPPIPDYVDGSFAQPEPAQSGRRAS